MILFVKLLLAHLLGDYFLQPNSWIHAKEQGKLKSGILYLHTLIHAILILLVMWDVSFVKWAFLLASVHLVIDGTKLLLQEEATKRKWFFIDQGAHLTTLVIFSLWYQWEQISWPTVDQKTWILVTLIIFVTYPTAILIRTIISKWGSQIRDLESQSLDDAGLYIGMLERLLVFVFASTGNWEGVGFLVAAKSIFRFGDLTNAHDRKLTEYILIGTLLSFGIATLAAILYRELKV